MRYAGIIKNDVTAAPGISVSFFTQGCPHHCPGCHNPETWDFNGGKEFTEETYQEISTALTANGITRTFSIMGGEPLCPQNLLLTSNLIHYVKTNHPDTKIYLWSGYTYKDLLSREEREPLISYILKNLNVLIDGPFIQKLRNVTLPMRGSSNQNIIILH